MGDMLKVAALAVTAALCAAVIRQRVRELGLVLALAAGALILSFALRTVSGARVLLEELSALAGLSPAVLSPVVKTVGISHSYPHFGGAVPGRRGGRHRLLCGDSGRSAGPVCVGPFAPGGAERLERALLRVALGALCSARSCS